MVDSLIALIKKPRVLLLVLASVTSLVIFSVGQYIIRAGANDPQIQMAEDTVAGLVMGLPAGAITPPPGRVIGKSLSPFTVVYDSEGNPISGSANYKDSLPKPPRGVFANALQHGQNRFTWQPEKGMRFAAVVLPYTVNDTQGYVMVAKSLLEIEKRVSGLCRIVFWGWVASVLLIILTSTRGLHHIRKLTSKSKQTSRK
ncbi:MAG: hypothetical protein RL641_11 [Candidatus Parcubacteria bacterium]|jgi:hypothetical protein